MVKRYTPCRKYFDQWDEDGYLTCEGAQDGEWVKYTTFVDVKQQAAAQIRRLKKHITGLQAALKTSNANAAPAAHKEIYE